MSNVSSAYLTANHKIFQLRCNEIGDQFLKCKAVRGINPAECVEYSQKETACFNNTIDEIEKRGCGKLANIAADCLNRNNMTLHVCKEQSEAALECFKKNK
eukprot:TRINITY_DN10120_c0_g1_i1.p1 TRINITY_DN10120_c0_g1~~TRINITY_DN10120_c0_g1_i1.p1  ORF type:complete len:101 (-),score=15.86 TRINITY_DN10120_c0_g1_i1:31-333(-)